MHNFKILITALCLLMVSVLFAQSSRMKKTKNTIVLVHGAYGAASNFDNVVPGLQNLGYKVITLDLPGHGDDKTDLANISLEGYRDKVIQSIGQEKNIILVGHSLGGAVISVVAEKIPAQISKLIYLTAFLPQNGETILGLTKLDKQSIFGKNLVFSEDHESATLKPDGMVNLLCQDCPKMEKQKLLAGNIPESLKPFATPIVLTDANFGRIPKYYIYAKNDHAIGPDLQMLMSGRTAIVKSYTFHNSLNQLK
jgi:pimeloyl-ACP methyl ester carboxylesterase